MPRGASSRHGLKENSYFPLMGITKRPLLFLYFFLQRLVKVAMAIFFHKVEVRHSENLPKSGPVVFVANHPNSTMDAFVISSITHRKIHYIGHAGLFARKARAWLLASCGVIPVHLASGSTDKERNIEAFEECYRVLERGEAISIFPEGISEMPRSLHKVKTGAARIILETERRNMYQLGVKLVPVGLYFFSRSRFRSKVLVNVGKSVDLKPFLALNEKDNFEAVSQLTAQIQRALEHLTVNIRHTELDSLIRDIETIYKDELMSDGSFIKEPSPQTAAEFLITRKIAECVEYFYEREPQRVLAFQEKIEKYKRKMKRLHLKDAWLKDRATFGQLLRAEMTGLAKAAISFPFAAYGILNNYIPYMITERIAKRYISERTKILTALFLGGGATFMLFYIFQTFIFWLLAGSFWASLYLVSLPFSGFFALASVRSIRTLRERVSLSFFLFTNRHLLGKMRQARNALVSELNVAKEEYTKIISPYLPAGEEKR